MFNPFNPQNAQANGVGLPQEYNEQLFTNLQGLNKAQGQANRRGILDNTRNPGMAGAQQLLLRQNQQQMADQALNQGTQVQLQGVQEGLTDRRKREEYDWQGGQNELNRGLEREKVRSTEGLARLGYENEAGTFGRYALNGALTMGLGAVGGPLLAGAGTALAKRFF